MKPGISFLIVNYHTADFVIQLVSSIKTHIHKFEFEILIWDNSIDEIERKKISNIDGVFIAEEGKNIGFVEANNRLFARANNNVIVAINPDVLLFDDSLEGIVGFVFNDQSIGVAGPMLLNGDRTYQVSYYRFPKIGSLLAELFLFGIIDPYLYKTQNDRIQQVDIVKGACLVFRKDVVKSGELFDKQLIMYSEEVDFCYRLKIMGLKTVYFPDTKIIHYGEQSSKKRNATEYSLYNYYRSKIILFKKYHSLKIKPLILFSLMLRIILFAFIGKIKTSLTHYKVAVKILETK